jgi:hypothetical protein
MIEEIINGVNYRPRKIFNMAKKYLEETINLQKRHERMIWILVKIKDHQMQDRYILRAEQYNTNICETHSSCSPTD